VCGKLNDRRTVITQMTREEALWSYADIAAVDPARAALLSSAPSTDQLAASVLARFEGAIRCGQLRVGMDESSMNPDDLRLTLQFHVGETLSDQFFNSTTGYRAQFRIGWERGLKYNNHIVEEIRSIVAALMPATFSSRRLSHTFEDCGSTTVTRDQACLSLDPNLSKVWFCTRLIVDDERIQQVPSGTTGPRLRLSDGSSWPAIARDEPDAWIDIKGAFLSRSGIYQLKDPVARAKNLAATGAA
jgi:hypothetical protein